MKNQLRDYNQHHKYNRMFWSWIVVYAIFLVFEITQLHSKSFQEGKILMFLVSVPLLIVGSSLYFIILAANIKAKKIDKLKLVFYLAAILLFIEFFISIRENADIAVRY